MFQHGLLFFDTEYGKAWFKDHGKQWLENDFGKYFMLNYRLGFLVGQELLVQPLYLVDKGPCELVEQTSKRLSCIDEENQYRSRRKDGRQITILPLFGVRVKRANRAREYCNPPKQSAKI
jgi:hypothetical protein